MKKIIILFLFTILLSQAFSQKETIHYTDSGSFLLHKFAQNIGRETYRMMVRDNKILYDIDFKFVDRGSPVPLRAQLIVGTSLDPVSFFINGKTSRFSTINDTVRITGKQVAIRVDDSVYRQPLKQHAFPVGGYSPGTVQMVLLQYWKKNHEPKTINLLPTGAVKIVRDGLDTLSFNNQPLLLERYVVSGLIWGNEMIWTDTRGRLVCLITNDAEGDKLEMMQEKYEALLPELISRAGKYGMRLFTTAMKTNTAAKKTLAIIGGNIIDVEGDGSFAGRSDILIENGLIKQIGKTGTVTIPANATIIHAEGKTILPGLWDMHAHFQQAEWGPAYLASGVTSIRDCGNEFEYINSIKAAIDAHKGIGPNIYKAGVIDGAGANGLGIIRATTREEAISSVQLYKNNGFAQIKIYSSVKPDIVKAISEEAHRLGLSVTGHIPDRMTIQQGVDSGMDQVNHIQYVFSIMKRNKDQVTDLADPVNIATLNFLKDRHVVIDPTIGIYEMMYRSLKDNITDIEPAFYSLPLPLQVLFKNIGLSEADAKRYKFVYDNMKNLVKLLYDNGVTIVAGTDMGFPGNSLSRELELYAEAGLTPLQALQTATIVPARVMKTDKKTGSVKTGKQADLVIIDGNPLQQIRDIRKVWKVIKEGQAYDPSTLRKMVGFIN
jgi:imidazolonepropionase-like amidohydrolase